MKNGIFKNDTPIIGMLHLPALPGSPTNRLSAVAIREQILKDADALATGGVDGMILENFGDVPFHPGKVPPHTATFMTLKYCGRSDCWDGIQSRWNYNPIRRRRTRSQILICRENLTESRNF